MNLVGKKLLLVEDDKSLREVLTDELQERGVSVESFAQLPSVQEIQEPEFALLDLRVGSENGFEFLVALKKKYPQVRVVMMSGFGSVASAVKSMQLGAYNFITKPVTADMILKAFADEGDLKTLPEEEISLARMEREYIDYVLQTSEGNITQAAKKLGLHRQSLQRKLRKHIPRK